jgi:hypothetical protein
MRQDRLMIAWQRDLENASSESEVVHLARRFLSAVPPNELARLPGECRLAAIDSVADVHAWNRRITQAYWELRMRSADIAVIQELWSFFLRAAIQLARIDEEAAASPR